MAWTGPRPATPPIAPLLCEDADVAARSAATCASRSSPLAPQSPDVASVAADIRVLLAAPVPGGGVQKLHVPTMRPRRTPPPNLDASLLLIAAPRAMGGTAALGSLRLPPPALEAFVEWTAALVEEAGVDADAATAPSEGWLTGDDVGVGSTQLLAAYDAARAARDRALDMLGALDAARAAAAAAPRDSSASSSALSVAVRARLLSSKTAAAASRLEEELELATASGRYGTMSRLEVALAGQRQAAERVTAALSAVVEARRTMLRASERSAGATEVALVHLREFVKVEVGAGEAYAGEPPPLPSPEAVNAARAELQALASQRGARLSEEDYDARAAAVVHDAQVTVAQVREAGDLAVTAAVAEAASSWDAELAALDADAAAAMEAASSRLDLLRARAELDALKRGVRALAAAALSAAQGEGERGGRVQHVYALLCRFFGASLRHAEFSEPLLVFLRGGLDRLLRANTTASSPSAAVSVESPSASFSGGGDSTSGAGEQINSLCSGWRRRHAAGAAAAPAPRPPSSLASSLRSLAAAFTSSGGMSLDVAEESKLPPPQIGVPLFAVSERPLPPAFNPPPRPRVDQDDDAFIASLLETLEQVEAVANRGHPLAAVPLVPGAPAAAPESPTEAKNEGHNARGRDKDMAAGSDAPKSTGANTLAETAATRGSLGGALTPILRRGDSARLRPAHITFNETVEVAIMVPGTGSEAHRADDATCSLGIDTDDAEHSSPLSAAAALAGASKLAAGASADIWAKVYGQSSNSVNLPPDGRSRLPREPQVRPVESATRTGNTVLTEQALDSVLSLLGLREERDASDTRVA